MTLTPTIQNFGHNVKFTPEQILSPANEAELLAILKANANRKIRVMGSRHSWSDAIVTEDTLIELSHFNQIHIEEGAVGKQVRVGAGCQLKTLLAQLNEQGLTLPAVGLIAEQTIAGIIATGTHGSGKHSLSHYGTKFRIACFSADGNPHMVEISEGVDLKAVRCALGCLGVVTEITLPCVPQYFVREKATPCPTIEAALALEAQSPIQQFFLIPHSWVYMVQERAIATESQRAGGAAFYRIYWFVVLDIGLHLMVKLFAAILRSRMWVHVLLRSLLPMFIFPEWVVVERSDRALLMRHELFRHFELEVFVRRSQITQTAAIVTDILRLADDPSYRIAETTRTQLESVGLMEALEPLKGRYTHHYPICIRRILPDDTLISMAAGTDEDWYSLSFITYVEPRDSFCAVAEYLATSLCALFQARIHWGKWFPHTLAQVEQVYPNLAEFKAVCDRYDPKGVFRNSFVMEKLGLKTPSSLDLPIPSQS